MLLIGWVATLYQVPRLFIKRLLTSNTACRLSDSTSVRSFPGAREKNLNIILLKPKGILLKYASINIGGGAGFRLARGSKPPAARPHLSVFPLRWLLALCLWQLWQPSHTFHHSHGWWRKAPKAQANTQCLSLGHMLILKPAMTWWWPDLRCKTHHKHRDWELNRHAPKREWWERMVTSRGQCTPTTRTIPRAVAQAQAQDCRPTTHSCQVTPYSKPQGLPAAAGLSTTCPPYLFRRFPSPYPKPLPVSYARCHWLFSEDTLIYRSPCMWR